MRHCPEVARHSALQRTDNNTYDFAFKVLCCNTQHFMLYIVWLLASRTDLFLCLRWRRTSAHTSTTSICWSHGRPTCWSSCNMSSYSLNPLPWWGLQHPQCNTITTQDVLLNMLYSFLHRDTFLLITTAQQPVSYFCWFDHDTLLFTESYKLRCLAAPLVNKVLWGKHNKQDVF